MCELYDLQDDPGQTMNRSRDPGLEKAQAELQARLFAWSTLGENRWRAEGQGLGYSAKWYCRSQIAC